MILPTLEIQGGGTQAAAGIAIRTRWARDGFCLVEYEAPAGQAASFTFPTPSGGHSTAYVLAGSYRATVAAHGDVPEMTETIAAGTFNHDDREAWPAGVDVTYEAEAGTRWRCWYQNWIPPSSATQTIHEAPAMIAVPQGAVLAVLAGATSLADGTFVLHAEDEAASVELTEGWAWLVIPN